MFTKCDLCHKPIDYEEPHHTINLHRERAHPTEHSATITVDYAETLLTTCISCGKNLHKEAVRRVLSANSPDKARMLGELFIPMKAN